MLKQVIVCLVAFAAMVAHAAISEISFAPSGVPAFIGKGDVAIGKLTFVSDKAMDKGKVEVSIKKTDDKDLTTLRLGDTEGKRSRDKVSFTLKVAEGKNEFPVFAKVPKTADLLHKLTIEEKEVRIGSVITRPNQLIVDTKRNSKNFRIPGIVETKRGTLVAVFDIRYNNSKDIPEDVTVGVSISKNQGRTWSPIHTAIDYKDLPGGKGIGDPCILVDPSNNRIWVAAFRAKGTGGVCYKCPTGTIDPKVFSQMILAYSDDEGKTWSKPINITKAVKRLEDPDTAAWGALFQGPGAGIAMKDGTLVFPAQIWSADGNKKQGALVYSKDHGKTWTSSKAMPWGGSESTVAQLPDGSLLFNTREGAGKGKRFTARTTDLGETWEKVPTDVLRQPGFCQAAYLMVGKLLYFSNPDAPAKRSQMTLRVSPDNGKTWKSKLVYDPRVCAGYSSLCTVGKGSIGIIYEGMNDYLYFLRIPEKDLK